VFGLVVFGAKGGGGRGDHPLTYIGRNPRIRSRRRRNCGPTPVPIRQATNTTTGAMRGVRGTGDDPGQVTPIGPKVKPPRGLHIRHGPSVHMIVNVNTPLLMQPTSGFTDQHNPLARQRIPGRDRV
jgi:hypothetical protein